MNNKNCRVYYHGKNERLLCSAKIFHKLYHMGKVFKNGPSKTCERHLKNLTGYGPLEAYHTPSNFLKGVFYKFYLVHSWILCSICKTNKGH